MKSTWKIPFNKPHLTHKEMDYISNAYSLGQLSGDGSYTKFCHNWLEKAFSVKKALLTHSCTAALEMMALLCNISPGDEVIIPSFTFSSTANAIVLRGGVPVFVDIRPDTLNIDENLIEEAITKKTKAIFSVHYAGVGCEMDSINSIAKKHKLFVIEDAAQGFLAKYKGKYLGTIGDMGAVSFHETKNIISGEGGALLINNSRFIERAEILREKGTNRSKFFRGEIDKYTWVDLGSSYLPGEIIAAFLYAQLEEAREITKRRLSIWHKYHEQFEELEEKDCLRRPIIPDDCEQNGHLYYIILNNAQARTKLIEFLRKKGILAIFHYIPLHSSPAGKKYTRFVGKMTVTNRASDTIIRLPLFYDITEKEIEYVIKSIKDFF
jgi:dTDP-4-amino-4,6-dideoxygalactose transaminase